MKEHDKIKELFSEKLGNYSAPVNPELWNAIAAKVAVGSTVATTGTSLFVKSIIGISAASVIGVAAYFVSQDEVVPTEQTIELNPTITAEQDVEKSTEMTPSVEQESYKQESTSNSNKVDNSSSVENSSSVKETNNETAPIFIEEKVSTYVPKERKTPLISETKENKSAGSKEEEAILNNSKESETKAGLNSEKNVKKQPEYLAEITLLPNSFTPNGDRVNDEFYIEFTGDLIDFNIVILDKQNRTLFESKDPSFRWNGMNRSGEFVPSGNYYYIVTASDRNGNPINQYNTLSIER